MSHTRARSFEVAPKRLRRRVDLNQLPLSTADVCPIEETIGQPRALDAITFGLEISSTGYNLFVAGPAGSGRERTVHDFLQRFAPSRPSPSDWVYVYNFSQADHPHAIRLPRSWGRKLAADLDEFLQAVSRDIPRVFESEDYAHHRRDALAELTRRRNALFEQLQTSAVEQSFVIEILQQASQWSLSARESRFLMRFSKTCLPSADKS